jgi:hypothetical protein
MPRGHYLVGRNPQDSRDIRFSIAPDAPDPIPINQRKVRQQAEETLTVLQTLFPQGDSVFAQYFERLLSACQGGLVGDNARPREASDTIEWLQDEILDHHGTRLRQLYLRGCLLWTITFAIILLVGEIALSRAGSLSWMQPFAAIVPTHFIEFWCAALVGSWLYLVMSKHTVGFKDLMNQDKDKLSSCLRVVFSLGITGVAGAVIQAQIIVLNLGKVSSADIAANETLAVGLGALVGLGISGWTNRLYKLAENSTKGKHET